MDRPAFYDHCPSSLTSELRQLALGESAFRSGSRYLSGCNFFIHHQIQQRVEIHSLMVLQHSEFRENRSCTRPFPFTLFFGSLPTILALLKNCLMHEMASRLQTLSSPAHLFCRLRYFRVAPKNHFGALAPRNGKHASLSPPCLSD